MPKVLGASTIIVGVTGCVIAAPSETKVEYSGDELEERILSTEGLVYISLLFGAFIVSVSTMMTFERMYPTAHVLSAQQPSSSHAQPNERLRLAPPWLEQRMGILYPLSLGLDEGAYKTGIKTAPGHASYRPISPCPVPSHNITPTPSHPIPSHPIPSPIPSHPTATPFYTIPAHSISPIPSFSQAATALRLYTRCYLLLRH